MKKAYEEKRAQMAAEAEASSSLFAVGGTVVGAVAGGVIAYVTGGAGAPAIAAGATIGGGLGKMAYSKTR
jgi:uncharacterized protein YcfJ